MTAFDDMASGFASFFGIDAVTAGIVLGFIFIVVMMIALIYLLGPQLDGIKILLPVGFCIGFVALVNWWPPWTILFIGFFLALVLVNPFRDRG